MALYQSTYNPEGLFKTFAQSNFSISPNQNLDLWRKFLGEPYQSSLPEENIPINEEGIPAAYRGKNKQLPELVKIGVYANQTWVTGFLLPMESSDDTTYEWTSLEFDPAIIGRVPERGTTKTLFHKFTTSRAQSARYGIGLLMNHGFLNTREGQLTFLYQMQQLQQSIIETQNYEALSTIVSASAPSSEMRLDYLTRNPRTLDEVIAHELAYFDIFKKVENAMELVETFISQTMTKYGGKADAYIVTEEMVSWYNLVPEKRRAYYFAGPDGVERGHSPPVAKGDDTMSTMMKWGDNYMFVIRPYQVGDMEPLNLLRFVHQIGEYRIAHDICRGNTQILRSGNYSSKKRSVGFYSWADDTIQELTLEHMWASQHRTGEDGRFKSFNHHDLRSVASFPDQLIKKDPFHYITSNGKQLPIRFLGHIFPGANIVSGKMNGETKDAYISPKDFFDMAYSTIPRFTKYTEQQMETRFGEISKVIQAIKSVTINANSLALLKLIADELKGAKGTTVRTSRPHNGTASSRGVPVRVSAENQFNFADLPDGVPATNRTSMPPGFASFAGLKTLQDFFIKKKRDVQSLGLDQRLFKYIDENIDFIEELANYLWEHTESCILNPKYAPSWMVDPTPADMFVANCISGNMHPLLLVTKDAGGEIDLADAANIYTSALNNGLYTATKSYIASSGQADPFKKVIEDFGKAVDALLPAAAPANAGAIPASDLISDVLDKSLFVQIISELFKLATAKSKDLTADSKNAVATEMNALLPLIPNYKTGLSSVQSIANDFINKISSPVGLNPVSSKTIMRQLIKKHTDTRSNAYESLIDKVNDKEKLAFDVKELLSEAILTPLTYSTTQYRGLMSANNKSGLWPSSAFDPYVGATAAELSEVEKLISPSPVVSSSSVFASQPVVPGLINTRIGDNLQTTSLYHALKQELDREGRGSFQLYPDSSSSSSGSGRIGDRFGDDDDDEERDFSMPTLTGGSKRKYSEQESFVPSEWSLTGELTSEVEPTISHISSGNFMGNFAAVSRMAPTPFIRAISQVYVGMEITYQTGLKLILDNIVFPFNFLLLWPHIEFYADALIKMLSRGGTGKLYFGHASLMFGDDAVQHTHYGTFHWNMAPVIKEVKNLWRMNAVFVKGLRGGAGAVLYDRNQYDPNSNRYNDDGKGSLFVTLIPRTCERLPQYFSVTGTFDGFSTTGVSELFYPTVAFDNALYGWHEFNTGTDAMSLSYGANIQHNAVNPNYVVLEAPTYYMDYEQNVFSLYRAGRSHFNIHTCYPGAADARCGRNKEYKHPNLVGMKPI